MNEQESEKGRERGEKEKKCLKCSVMNEQQAEGSGSGNKRAAGKGKIRGAAAPPCGEN